ncbi:MAG: hypothetical protein GXX91_14735 [Verrucomicrobiaceae bacterium]|nr:hypothetical protein [Verrucomicrobiaceae bacterium]
MKTRCVSSGLLLLALWAVPVLDAEVRQWTRASDGKKIAAEFAGVKDEHTVKIKLANGQIYEVPLAGLSVEDNAFIREMVAKEGGATKPEGTPSTPDGVVTITLSKVHICCRDCEEAIATLGANERTPLPAGVVLTPSRREETVVITAPSTGDARAALRSFQRAGFYGKSDNDEVKIEDLTPDDATADSMTVRSVPLCCDGCVRAFAKAVESVDGVRSHTAEGRRSSRITVEGKGFKPYEVMQALRDAGFGGGFE